MNEGDYVRIVRGNTTYIRKIKSIYLKRMGGKKINEIIVDKPFDYRYTINDDKVLKSSPNIIDLIEEGDYVNGFYVINKPFNQRIHTEFDDFFEEDIKSIVTKEQFESMEYKVGE